MAWFACLGAGGGGSVVEPTFSKTKIADNSLLADSFSATDDFHDYDFVEFVATSDSGTTFVKFVTTPDALDAIFAISSDRVCINLPDTSTYITYSYDSQNMAFTKTNESGLKVYEINGYICTNKTVTEDELYKATSRSTSNITVNAESGVSFFDYDMIIFCGNASLNYNVLPCAYICYPKSYFNDEMGFAFNYYNGLNPVTIKETTIGSSRIAYAGGIKFT